MKIVPINQPKGDIELANHLRKLADAAESGELQDFISVCIIDGQYEFNITTSVSQGIFLSAILHRKTLDKMYA